MEDFAESERVSLDCFPASANTDLIFLRLSFKSDYWKKHHLITTGPAEIDDASESPVSRRKCHVRGLIKLYRTMTSAWDELEPKVVKVVKHCRELKQKAAGEARIQGRLDFLREKMYDKRRADATEFPLFADFCLFPSVLKLLDLEDTTYEQLSMKRLKESNSAIYEEVEEWTEKNRLEAVKLILSRTLEADEFGVLDDEDSQVYADDEAWFENVQTFVFCDVSGCATSSPYRQLFFGSYDALLAHQHEVHGDLKPKFSKQATQKKKKKQDGRFEIRFSLPSIVADSLAELLDMLEFEPDDSDGICRVTEEGLSRIFVGGTSLQWENAPRVGFGKSKKDTDWLKIVRHSSLTVFTRRRLTIRVRRLTLDDQDQSRGRPCEEAETDDRSIPRHLGHGAGQAQEEEEEGRRRRDVSPC